MKTLLAILFAGALHAQAPLPAFSGSGGGGGGATAPGGSNTQCQYNNSSAFGGITGCTSDGTNLLVTTQSASDSSTKAASTAFVHSILLDITVNSVNANASTGAFSCDFSLGYICLVNDNGFAGGFLTPTLTNLPTNHSVKFIFNMVGATGKGVVWPSGQVLCTFADSTQDCGTSNAFAPTGGKFSATFFSDGTTLFASGDAGFLPNVKAGHVDVTALTVNDQQSGSGGGFIKTWDTPFNTLFNCTSAASPATCGAAIDGSVVVAAGATTVVVNTTNVKTASQIIITPDSSLGAKLSVTCNTAIPTFHVSARVDATSFTIELGTTPIVNPSCFNYHIVTN